MFKEYRIFEIGEVVGGGTPSTNNPDYWNGSIPWITPNDLTGYSSVYISNGKNYITELGLRSGTKLLPAGALLFTSRAPIGYIAIANNPICTNQGFKSIICNDKCNNLYLYYYLKQNLPYIKLFGTGATFPEISGNVMKKIKINIIADIKYQKSIATILSVYDDLIENNNKRIQILEQMAQELYKEWFVRFRFPGHEKVKYKDTCFGKIPDMFSLVKMQDVFEYYIGGGWGNEDSSDKFPVGAYVIRGTDFSRVIKGDISTLPFRYHKNSNYKSRQLKPYDIIIEISGGTSEQPVGRAIFITNNILNRLGNKAICASFCKLIRLQTNKISPMYFHYWMKYLYDTRFIDRFQLQSTGIINFKFEYFLRKGDVLLPSQEIMKNFECAIRPLHDQIDLLATINANLAKQRDLLLPRLMSGKLEIKGIPDA